MTDDRIEGVGRQGLGRVQDAVGGLTGNGKTQAEGKFNEALGAAQDAYGQIKGRAQDAYGQVRDQAQDAYGQVRGQAQDLLGEVETFAREQPLKALAIGAAVGLFTGLLLRGGRKTVYVRK